MPLILATSYDGFWMFAVLLATLVAGIPLGIIAIVARWRKIAVGCGSVYILFGAWMLIIAAMEESEDRTSMTIFASALLLVGTLLATVRRRPAADRIPSTDDVSKTA